MKISKALAVVTTIALISTIGVTAFASTNREGLNNVGNARVSQATREERTAEREAIQVKYDALTDAQKAELVALKNKALDVQVEKIDKYLSLGLIDADKATELKAAIEEKRANTEDCTGGVLGMMNKGSRGMKMNRSECTDCTIDTATESV